MAEGRRFAERTCRRCSASYMPTGSAQCYCGACRPTANANRRSAWARANANRTAPAHRAAALRDYYRHHDQHLARSRAYRKQNLAQIHTRETAVRLLRRAFVDAARAGGCVDCGNKHLGVLQSDHVRGTKLGNIAVMATTRSRTPLAILFAELNKCETVCANCHQLRTTRRIAERSA